MKIRPAKESFRGEYLPVKITLEYSEALFLYKWLDHMKIPDSPVEYKTLVRFVMELGNTMEACKP